HQITRSPSIPCFASHSPIRPVPSFSPLVPAPSLVPLPPPPSSTLFPYTTLFRSSASVRRSACCATHLGSASAVRGGSPQVSRTRDRKSTRLNSSHVSISYAVFCLKKKKIDPIARDRRDRHTGTRAHGQVLADPTT